MFNVTKYILNSKRSFVELIHNIVKRKGCQANILEELEKIAIAEETERLQKEIKIKIKKIRKLREELKDV